MRLVADGLVSWTEVNETMSLMDLELLGEAVDTLHDARNTPIK